LPYVCGCFGGLCPSCHVGLLGRNGNQRVWSTHVRIRCAKLSGIWRHVWSWVDSHRRGVILHVLRVLLGILYRRVSIAQLWAVIIGVIAVLLGVVALVTMNDGWVTAGRWLMRQTALRLA